MNKINLIGTNDKNLSANINNEQNINCYIVPSKSARNGVALVGSPGTVLFSSNSGEMRGCIETNASVFFVVGNYLYEVTESGSKTSLGSVPGQGLVSVAFDGTSIIVVNGTSTAYFYNTSTATYSAVTLPTAAYTVTMIDTYAVFSSTGQRWFISDVGDTDSYDALNFAFANKSPDDLVAVIEDHSEVFLFGKKTTEPFFNNADIDFPFAQNTAGVIERGLYARFSLVKEDNTLFFLGDDLLVYRLQGYTPIRISSTDVELALSDILKSGGSVDLRNAYAFVYYDHGGKFYQLTIPNQVTLVFDISTNEWHTKKHWNYDTHHAVCCAKSYNKTLIGALDGSIYEMSRSYYSDGDYILKRIRRSTIYSSGNILLHWKAIEVIMETGTTSLATGQGSDPKIVFRWSDNNGRTYGNETFLSIGQAADYLARVIRRNCGASRARIFEFYITDPVPFVVVDAVATVR